MLSFLRKLLRCSSRRRPRPAYALTLEALEGRLCPSYTIIDLGTLGGAMSEARAINSVSHVVGRSTTAAGQEHAFFWQNGTMTDLGTLGGASSVANDVNDAGQVVGASEPVSGAPPHAFLWQAGFMTDLGTLGGNHSEAYAVNGPGHIVGFSETGAGGYHAFVREGGVLYDLNALLPAGADLELTFAMDINDNGQIVGQGQANGMWRAFLFTDDDGVFANGGGVVTDLGTLGGAEAEAFSINSLGQIAGWAHTSQGWPHAFRSAGGVMTDLQTLGGSSSYANAINDAGQVVGTALLRDESARAFLWQNGAISDLNNLIGSTSGWTLNWADDINPSGEIVGAGSIAGQDHAFLLRQASTPTAPSLTISDVTVTEGHAGATGTVFTVTLSAASDQTVSIAYATADGAATAGSDYEAAAGTLTFAPGETSKTLTVWVTSDRLGEPNENFFVNLSSPVNATVGDGQGVAGIVDDEPRVSISDVIKKEGNGKKTTLFIFTVTLSAAHDQPVTMSFRTADGTATAGEDYVARTGTLTFAPGETTKTITIEVKGDSKKEADETFSLELFAASGNSVLADWLGLGTILNDD